MIKRNDSFVKFLLRVERNLFDRYLIFKEMNPDITQDELVEQYRSGINRDDIISYIFCENYALFHKQLSKFYKQITIDELHSILIMTISKGLETYDDERGIKKITNYIYHPLLYHNLIIHIRHLKKIKYKNTFSLNYPLKMNENCDIYELQETLGYQQIEFEDIFEIEIYKEFMQNLRLRDLQIIEGIQNGLKQHEIAEIQNVSQSNVSRRIKKIKDMFSTLNEERLKQ